MINEMINKYEAMSLSNKEYADTHLPKFDEWYSYNLNHWTNPLKDTKTAMVRTIDAFTAWFEALEAGTYGLCDQYHTPSQGVSLGNVGLMRYLYLIKQTKERSNKMMSKWDTIQADVADMYIGQVENEAYYASLNDKDYVSADDLFDQDDLLTLDWEG